MKCATKECNAEGTVKVLWPGQPVEMCRPCAMRAKTVADALGFELYMRNLVEQPTITIIVADPEVDDG